MKTTLRVLGEPSLSSGPDVFPLQPTKPTLLLLHLAITGSWVSREELLHLFRPVGREDTGRHYVRNLLSRARTIAGVRELEVQADRCRWSVSSDLNVFRQAVKDEQWYQAVTSYGGPLLRGFEVDDASEFGNWLESERRALHTVWQQASLSYALDQEQSGRFMTAVSTLASVLRDDPLNEHALVAFVRNAYLAGDRDRALEAAQTFTSQLRQELDLEPMADTLRLLDQVQGGQTIQRAELSRTWGRRWTDLAHDSSSLDDLVAILKDPSTRVLSLLDSDRAGSQSIILAKRVPDMRLALRAITDLAETLIHERAFSRATELLVLVLTTAPERDAVLHGRIERLWDELAPHLPEPLIDSVKRRW